MGNLIWDYQIISFLTVGVIAFFLILKNIKERKLFDSKKTKRKKYLLAGFALLFTITVFYGSFIEPRLIIVNEVDINIGKTDLHESLKIVHISDLHAGPYKKTGYYERLSRRINELQPDLVVITGDHIYRKEESAIYLKGLEGTSNVYPTYAITGNHEYNLGLQEDYFDDKLIDKTTVLKKVFEKIGIQTLENQGLLLHTKNGQVHLSGIQEIWSQPEHVENQLRKMAKKTSNETPKILLSHNPDVINATNSSYFDIILSGHTHGGQIRLPIIGSIASLPTELGRKFDRGLFELNEDTKLYINQGIGEAGPRARLFCPPEITVLTIDL